MKWSKKALKARSELRVQYESRKDWKKRARRQIQVRDGNICFFCNYPFNDEFPPTLEHLLPVAAGGSDHISNLVLACEPCNKTVGDWPLVRKIKYREYRLISRI